jgi:hypothetical protein
MRALAVVSGLAVAMLWTAAPAFADDGCTRALKATANTPGHAFVALHCTSQGATAPSTTPSAGTETATPTTQTGVQGCALGLASAAGTPGEPFVRAACNKLASELGLPPPAAEGPGAAVSGAQAVTAGCDVAIQATSGTTAEPFVRAGCAEAVANATAASPSTEETSATSEDEEQSPQTDDTEEDSGSGP